MEETKICTKCGEEQPVEAFAWWVQKTQRQSYCRQCISWYHQSKKPRPTHKLCPACGETKPRTAEHWHWYLTRKRGVPQIDGYCIPCRRANARQNARQNAAPAVGRAYTSEAAIYAYRAGNISTLALYDVLAAERGPAAAQQIVNQERAAHGLPPMRLG